MIRWGGYPQPNDPSWSTLAGFPGLYTKFKHRLPKHWYSNPVGSTNRFGLYSNDVSLTIDTQAIVDAEIDDAANAGVGWFFVHYPHASDLGADNSDATTIRSGVLDHYRSSTHKSEIKFAIMVQPTWLGWPNNSFSHWTAILADLADIFSDPQYLRINGNPVVGFFGANVDNSETCTTAGTTGPCLPASKFSDIVTAAGGAIFGVSTTHSNSTTLTYNLNCETSYGPNPSLPVGTSRDTWATQYVRDQGNWGPLGGGHVPCTSLSPVLDGRPIGARTFVDKPTQPEWQRSVRAGLEYANTGVHSYLLSVYAWDEVAEGGDFVGVNEQAPETGKSRFLDAIAWERGAQPFPSSYTYEINSSNAGGAVSRSGAGWTTAGPTPGATLDGSQIDGAKEEDEERDSTAGDTETYTLEAAQGAQLMATTGPDRGKISVAVDGGAPTTVDLYAAGQTVHNAVWTSGALDDHVTHTVVVTVLGTKNAASSSVMVGIDSMRHTYNPQRI